MNCGEIRANLLKEKQKTTQLVTFAKSKGINMIIQTYISRRVKIARAVLTKIHGRAFRDRIKSNFLRITSSRVIFVCVFAMTNKYLHRSEF